MSHRWNCPTDWEARHEGERAFDYGRSPLSNPYEDDYWNRDRACPEAAEEWDRGYRSAEMRAEEEREEEAARQRAAMRRAEADEWDDYAQAQEYYAMQDERQLVESEEPPAVAAVDPGVENTESSTRDSKGSHSHADNSSPDRTP